MHQGREEGCHRSMEGHAKGLGNLAWWGLGEQCSRRNHLRSCARLPQVQVLSKDMGAAKRLLGQTQRFQASGMVCGVLTAGSRSRSLTCEVDGI